MQVHPDFQEPAGKALVDIADDLAALKVAAPAADGSTAIAAADAAATAIADADATYGQPEADLINDLKAKYNAAVTLANELKVDYTALRTLVLDLRTKLVTQSGVVLKTTKLV